MLSKRRFKIAHLLVVAAMLHVALSVTIMLVGKSRLMPSQFSEGGIGAFAYDSFLYEAEVERLAKLLKTEGVVAWASSPSELHVRLYSLPYAVVSSWGGFNILIVEPLNLALYLLIITLIYKIGCYAFDHRAGLLAASIVAFWPSLLFHTTQLLRDSFTIVALLALVFGVIKLIQQHSTWQRSLWLLTFVALAAVLNWILRMASWDVGRLILFLSIVGLLIQQWRDKRPWSNTLVKVAALIAIMLLTPQTKALFKNQQSSIRDRDKVAPIAERVQGRNLWETISIRRHGFATTTFGDDRTPVGSNIDADVEFNNPVHILLYLPRAAAIGFLTPFPSMWVEKGNHVGMAGRALSGAEMFLTYVIELLALVGLWSKRKDFIAWLLFLTASAAMVGLALIVTNVGTLYRERYPFWILLAILGSGGALLVCSLRQPKAEGQFVREETPDFGQDEVGARVDSHGEPHGSSVVSKKI